MPLSKATGSPYPLIFTSSILCDCHFKTTVARNFTQQWRSTESPNLEKEKAMQEDQERKSNC